MRIRIWRGARRPIGSSARDIQSIVRDLASVDSLHDFLVRHRYDVAVLNPIQTAKQVTKGIEVVDQIAGAKRNSRDLPDAPVAMTSVTIHDEA